MKLDKGRTDGWIHACLRYFRYASLNEICTENIWNPLQLEHRSKILHMFILFYRKYRKLIYVQSYIYVLNNL
jgi:hypothetical protein